MKSTAILIDLVNNQNKCNTSLPSLYLIENIICYFRGSLNFLTPLVSIKVMAEHLEKGPPLGLPLIRVTYCTSITSMPTIIMGVLGILLKMVVIMYRVQTPKAYPQIISIGEQIQGRQEQIDIPTRTNYLLHLKLTLASFSNTCALKRQPSPSYLMPPNTSYFTTRKIII